MIEFQRGYDCHYDYDYDYDHDHDHDYDHDYDHDHDHDYEQSRGIRTMEFSHERLDVYRISLEFVCFVAGIVGKLKGDYRHARDQLLRSSQSIPLNIAEGNGKRSPRDRKRFFEIARGSAMEAAATLDVLVCLGAFVREEIAPGKSLLLRVVSMLSRMT